MNNIQKSFKNKAKVGLRMAVGGVINESVDPQNQWGGGGGLVSMDHDPMADMNSLDKVQTLSSQGNPFYTPGSRNDPHASSIQTTANQSAKPATPYVEATRNRPLRNTITPVEDLFPQKGLRLADGGIVETPEQVMARMAAKYGAVPSQPAVEAPRPVTPPVSPPAPQAKSGGLLDNALRGLRGRAAQIDKAVGMAQGGVVKISGPGTGTSDDIPLGLRSNGKKIDVNVSDGEALAVLPAKTAQNPNAIDAVNEIIETTNGKPPKGLRAGGHYADGTIDEQVARAGYNRLYGDRSAAMAMPAQPAPEQPTSEQSNTAPVDVKNPSAALPFMSPVPEGTNEQVARAGFRSLYGNRAHVGNRTPITQVAQTVAAAESKPNGNVVPIAAPQAQAPATQPPADPAQAAAAAREEAMSRSLQAGKLVGEAQGAMNLPAGADAMARGNAGLRAIANDTTNVRSKLNAAHEVAGDGIRYSAIKGADGKQQTLIMGTGNGPATGAMSKDAVLDAWGNDTRPTTAMKKQLEDLRRENTKSDLASPGEFYQQRGLRALAGEKVMAEADAQRAKGAMSPLDLAKFQLDQQKFALDVQGQQNMQKNSENERSDKRMNQIQKDVDDVLTKRATSGKDFDPQRYSALKRWEANFRKNSKLDGNEYIQDVLRRLDEEAMIEDRGTHLLTPENPSDGRVTTLREAKSSWRDLVQPSNWFGGQVYESNDGRNLRMTMPSGMTDAQVKEFNYYRLVGKDGMTQAQRDSLNGKK